MKSITKVAIVATLLMVLLFAAQPSLQQEDVPQPSVFLGNLLTDLQQLGLIKSTSVERKQFDKNEMNLAITNLARMVRYLLILKGQGKDEEVSNWVDSLKMSKKFSSAVRMVRKLMRKLAKQQQAAGQSPKFVVPVKGVINTVMKKALAEMKALLEQSATVAQNEAVATPQVAARPRPTIARPRPSILQVATKPTQTNKPTPVQAQKTWTAVEKMAHKMAKVTAVAKQPESSDDEEANPEEAHLVWEAVEKIAHKMAQVAAEPEPAVEPTADIVQG